MASKYRDLVAWQRSMFLVTRVYDATRSFPGDETFGLTAQLRRAAVSVPSNIAEGAGRTRGADQRRFMIIARVSLMELETQLLIAQQLAYLPRIAADALLREVEETMKPLNGLIASLK